MLGTLPINGTMYERPRLVDGGLYPETWLVCAVPDREAVLCGCHLTRAEPGA
jgi:hypothetical protein